MHSIFMSKFQKLKKLFLVVKREKLILILLKTFMAKQKKAPNNPELFDV